MRGIQKMVDEDRYCADVLTQISAVQEALRAGSRELMRNHLKYCASTAIRGTPEQAEVMYNGIAELTHKRSCSRPARRAEPGVPRAHLPARHDSAEHERR